MREFSTLALSRELSDREWDILAKYTDHPNEWMAELSRQCPWMPTIDRCGIALADVERIYASDAAEWLRHLISVFLGPWMVLVNGSVLVHDAYSREWKQIMVDNSHVLRRQPSFHFTPDGELRDVTLV